MEQDHNFLILSEFSETFGPVPVLAHPPLMNMRAYSMVDVQSLLSELLAVDYSSTTDRYTRVRYSPTATHPHLYAQALYFNLFDVEARGQIRRFCLTFCTSCSANFMGVDAATFDQFLLCLSAGNISHYLSDLMKYPRDLRDLTHLNTCRRLFIESLQSDQIPLEIYQHLQRVLTSVSTFDFSSSADTSCAETSVASELLRNVDENLLQMMKHRENGGSNRSLDVPLRPLQEIILHIWTKDAEIDDNSHSCSNNNGIGGYENKLFQHLHMIFQNMLAHSLALNFIVKSDFEYDCVHLQQSRDLFICGSWFLGGLRPPSDYALQNHQEYFDQLEQMSLGVPRRNLQRSTGSVLGSVSEDPLGTNVTPIDGNLKVILDPIPYPMTGLTPDTPPLIGLYASSGLFPNSSKIGRGVLSKFLLRYSFAKHIIFCLLTGRLVVVKADHRKEDQIRALIRSLALFVPGFSSSYCESFSYDDDSSSSETRREVKVVPWGSVLTANIKLIGIPRFATIDTNMQPNIFDFDYETFEGYVYEKGSFLNLMLNSARQAKDDSAAISIILSHMAEMVVKAKLYMKMFEYIDFPVIQESIPPIFNCSSFSSSSSTCGDYGAEGRGDDYNYNNNNNNNNNNSNHGGITGNRKSHKSFRRNSSVSLESKGDWKSIIGGSRQRRNVYATVHAVPLRPQQRHSQNSQNQESQNEQRSVMELFSSAETSEIKKAATYSSPSPSSAAAAFRGPQGKRNTMTPPLGLGMTPSSSKSDLSSRDSSVERLEVNTTASTDVTQSPRIRGSSSPIESITPDNMSSSNHSSSVNTVCAAASGSGPPFSHHLDVQRPPIRSFSDLEISAIAHHEGSSPYTETYNGHHSHNHQSGGGGDTGSRSSGSLKSRLKSSLNIVFRRSSPRKSNEDGSFPHNSGSIFNNGNNRESSATAMSGSSRVLDSPNGMPSQWRVVYASRWSFLKVNNEDRDILMYICRVIRHQRSQGL